MPLPNRTDMLTRLIAAPSVSSTAAPFDMSNRPVVDLVAEWLAALGFAVQILPIDGHPSKFNVLGILGRGPGGLLLAGHTDTVPCDADAWRQTEPFTLRAAAGRLYGLGMADMKSFFAFALEAASRFRAEELQAPLTILGTADEETSMCGAKALHAAQLNGARAAVIGEPTGNRPVRSHKGILMEGIRVLGRAGHSSDPALGASALEGMQRVMAALLDFRTELQARHRDPTFHVPVPTLNLGHIHGGDNPNRICASCELHLDLRVLPGMDVSAMREALHNRVRAALADTGLNVAFTPLFDGVNALATPVDSPIARACAELTGHAPETVAFTTEGPYLQACGTETIILGPGDIAQAHQADEYLDSARIEPYVALLEKLITRFCLQADAAVQA